MMAAHKVTTKPGLNTVDGKEIPIIRQGHVALAIGYFSTSVKCLHGARSFNDKHTPAQVKEYWSKFRPLDKPFLPNP